MAGGSQETTAKEQEVYIFGDESASHWIDLDQPQSTLFGLLFVHLRSLSVPLSFVMFIAVRCCPLLFMEYVLQ